jgi:proprotein convertase subtilisin/kexin type 2
MKIRGASVILMLALPLALTACGGGGPLDPLAPAPPPTTGTVPSTTDDTRNCSFKYSITQAPILTGSDPKLVEQWHLQNTAGGNAVDLRAIAAWTSTKGENTRVAVVDDAIETIHADLAENVVPNGSFNFFGGSALPLPCFAKDNHGTEVAGILAARDNNGIGVAGVAPRAKLVGFNALEAGTDQAIIDSMQRDNQLNHIFHNSWGSTDDGFQHAADSGWSNAIDQGIKTGRGGKGSIFVFAAGNGGNVELDNKALHVDNSNLDGYVNRIGVIAACALDDNGGRPFFSEFGVNQLVCAPAYGASRGVTTTSVQNGYTSDFIGTSASAPMVSGVIALMLSVNPNLTWRDVPIILAQTARKTSLNDLFWDGTGTGKYNPFFGFGIVDAEKAVAAAKAWVSVGDSSSLQSCNFSSNPNLLVRDEPALVTDQISVSANCAIRIIEYIDVSITSDHPYSADLRLKLISPSGTISQLTYPQTCGKNLAAGKDPCKQTINNWRYGVVRHMNETSLGVWKLEATDTVADTDVGRINSWSIKIWGRP